MFYDLIPAELQSDFDTLLNDLSYLPEKIEENCPFCHHDSLQKVRQKPLNFRCKGCHKYFNPLTMTPFNRLGPLIWLGMILTRRIEKTTYSTLAFELDCTIEMVKRRDHALIAYMADHYPRFHQWYTKTNLQSNDVLPELIQKQYDSLVSLIKQLLTIKQVSCLYCDSPNTVRIGNRTGFRCKDCRKTFSLLNRTPINKMPYPEQWITFINLLVANETNLTIAKILNLNSSTVTKWRRVWSEMMQTWGYIELAVWCAKKSLTDLDA